MKFNLLGSKVGVLSVLFLGLLAARLLASDSSEFTSMPIGNPQPVGSLFITNGGFDLAGAGSDIGAVSDQFQFAYREQAGDFDVKVRVQSLDNTDVWAKAGLMARDSLEPGAVFAATMASPSLAGCFTQARTTPNTAALPKSLYPVNYPDTWLRLQRTGDVFTSFASLDGRVWTILGTNSLVVTNPVLLGFAVTSHATNRTALARFRDFSPVSDGILGYLPPTVEYMGPSSRKTGLAITEIMCKPATRLDDVNLEFIELFNSNPFFEDIGGYRISGDIDYTFPEGTILPGGGLIVIAKTPSAVMGEYQLSGVHGPYVGNLKQSGVVRLRNRPGAILLEVPYSNQPPWPVAADGTGHSLVLARPSYGEANPMAWAASAYKGGSPGSPNATRSGPLQNVMINEILASPAAAGAPGATVFEDFIEIYNHSNDELDLSGCFLSDDAATNKFQLPAGTRIAPRGYLVVTATQLGFGLSSAGETVYFTSADQKQVIDAVRFQDQQTAVSTGRYPDGSLDWQPLASTTPGSSNSGALPQDIAINEIMFNPISGNDDDQYIELFNRGANKVDVGGWAFTDGINYTLPPGSSIEPGGYLVVAKNAARLRGIYTRLNDANTVGDFQGKLSHGGERLALSRPVPSGNPAKPRMVLVQEIVYGTGGKWPHWADGGGSSMELKDARADNRQAANWADSDETAKAPWTTVEYTGVLDLGKTTIDSLHVLLLGEGECLLDTVEVFATDNPTNLIANANFENGITGWVCTGNHIRSSLESTEGFESAKSLHIRSSGRGDTGANRIRVPLVKSGALRAGQTATIRAKVRWLRGFPEIVLRLKGNYLEAFGRMTLPAAAGTPGLVNSMASTKVGPAIFDVSHSPALPAANQPVVVTARAGDPDGIARLELKYRVDPATNYTSLAMRDDGTDGDAVAGDGIYSVIIPGQAATKLAAFHIEAADSVDASSLFPPTVPASECLVRFGEPVANSSFGTYRFWVTAAKIQTWTARPVLSNEEVDGTFVYGNQRVVYGAGFRYSGSPWHQGVITGPAGGPVTYAMSVPADDQVLGTTSFNKIHAPGNTPGDDGTIQCEQAAYWMVRQLGLPWNYQRYISVFFNGARRGTLMEDTQVPGDDVIEENFPDDADGPLFKLGGWYEFDPATTGAMNFNGQVDWCSLNNFTNASGEKKTARYRYNWSPRAVKGTANDYSQVFALVDAANTPPTGSFLDNMNAAADMEQWLRTFAIEHAVGNWDSFGYRNAQNMYAYKPSKDKWKLIIWDFNIVLGNSGSDSGSGNLFSFNYSDRGMARIYNNAEFMRSYLRNLSEIVAGPLSSANVGPVLDARYAAFRANGLTSISPPTSIKNWVNTQHKAIKSYLTNFAIPFVLNDTTNNLVVTGQNVYTLTGIASLDVKTISVNGRHYPVVWDNVVTWHALVPLNSATNRLVVQALDTKGNAISGASGELTVAYEGTIESPQNNLVINEIMYHPSAPNAEYVELRNRSSNTVIDLSQYKLEGVNFTFGDGTLIEPGGYLVVVKNRAAFLATYPGGAVIAGEFGGILNSQTLRLVAPGNSGAPASSNIINEVTYNNTIPWPEGADGTGASLQLVESASDNSIPSSWQAITPDQAAHPQWQFVSVTGVASTNSNLLVYHSPFQAIPDPMDIAGQWTGTISFPGLEYSMTVEFQRTNGTQWTGGFYGEDFTTPLTGIKYSSTNIYFVLDNTGGAVRFQGKVATNGLTISGTFSQDTPQGTQSLPFKLAKVKDTSIRWGGDCYIDNLSLVAGETPEAGVNLIADGDFENALSGIWNIATNHGATALSPGVKLAGASSLYLVASRGGNGLDTALSQSVQGLVPGQTYTLSYWYLPGTNGTDLTVRMEDSSLSATRSLLPLQIATPGLPNSSLLGTEQPIRITAIRRTSTGDLILEWNAATGQIFKVLSSDTLSGGQWTPIAGSSAFANGVYSAVIPNADDTRFFRVRVEK